jgi:hypothetical protein
MTKITQNAITPRSKLSYKFTKSLSNTPIFMEGFPLIPRTPPLSLKFLIVE